MAVIKILIALNIISWSLLLMNNFNMLTPTKPTNQNQHIQQDRPKEKSRPNEISDLGITFQDFKDRYNNQLKERNIQRFQLQNLQWGNKSDVKTFFCNVGGTVVIFGDVDKQTDKLIQITVGSEPKKSTDEKSIVEVTALIHAVMIKTLNPSLSEQNLADIGRKLGENLKRNSVSDGDFRYKSTFYNGMLLLSIEPNNS